MKRWTWTIIAIPVFLFLAISPLYGADVEGLIQQGLKDLGVRKGDPRICAITDATYVKLDGKTTEEYVDLIQEITGCSIGRGNLLFFHRPITYPLKIALFRKDTKECVLITYDGKEAKKISVQVSPLVISSLN